MHVPVFTRTILTHHTLARTSLAVILVVSGFEKGIYGKGAMLISRSSVLRVWNGLNQGWCWPSIHKFRETPGPPLWSSLAAVRSSQALI